MIARGKPKRPRGRKLLELPWDYSPEPKAGDKPMNREDRMPPQIAEASELLAKMSAVGELILRVQNLDVPDPCRSCAFRSQTIPNRCIDTVGDALKCVFEGQLFFCHEERDVEPIDKICKGWMRARAWAVEAEKAPAIYRAVMTREIKP